MFKLIKPLGDLSSGFFYISMMLYRSIVILVCFLSSCSSVKSVQFDTYIDTKDKTIEIQEKKIFKLETLGVFASNTFKGARLNGFEQLNDSTVLVKINPENTPINHSPYYAFEVWSKKPRTLYLRFDYPDSIQHRYHPKIKTKGKWTISDTINHIIQNDKMVLKVDISSDRQVIAAQNVESSDNVELWCKNLIHNSVDNPDINISEQTYGKSKMGQDLTVLEINNGQQSNKDVIVLITRQHPPEITGYLAFKAFVEQLVKSSETTHSFFDRYQIIAFPLFNPDGVDLGHWRHNASGIDTNRDWSEYHQPETKNAVKFITKYLKRHNSKLIIGLDFHSTWYDVFYTNPQQSKVLPHFKSQWFNQLELAIPGYKVNESSNNSKKPVSKGWFLKQHNAVGITFEIGDDTPIETIKQVGNTAAQQLMTVLLESNSVD